MSTKHWRQDPVNIRRCWSRFSKCSALERFFRSCHLLYLFCCCCCCCSTGPDCLSANEEHTAFSSRLYVSLSRFIMTSYSFLGTRTKWIVFSIVFLSFKPTCCQAVCMFSALNAPRVSPVCSTFAGTKAVVYNAISLCRPQKNVHGQRTTRSRARYFTATKISETLAGHRMSQRSLLCYRVVLVTIPSYSTRKNSLVPSAMLSHGD